MEAATAPVSGAESVPASTLLRYMYTNSHLYHEALGDVFPADNDAAASATGRISEQRAEQEKQKPEKQEESERQPEGHGHKVDWDTYPLPEEGQWQRRRDKKSGRVSGVAVHYSPCFTHLLTLF